MTPDPISQRMHLLLCLSAAENECEVQACHSAIRILEWHYPWLKTVAFIEQEQPEYAGRA